MGENSKISWCTDSFNTHWGCTEVPSSGACENCYAREFSKRFGLDIWGNDKPRKFFGDKHWNEPKRWDAAAHRSGQRRRIFVNSMSDTFEGRRDLDETRLRLFNLIPECMNCDWLLLTKRPQNVLRMVPNSWLEHWPSNVWLGTTAEDQRWADIRLPFLKDIPARVKFVSIEPMLEAIDLSAHVGYLSWCVVGGESGHHARKMELSWCRDILDQCRSNGIKYHFKQKGSVLAQEMGCKDKAGKDISEWPAEFRVQEFPEVQMV